MDAATRLYLMAATQQHPELVTQKQSTWTQATGAPALPFTQRVDLPIDWSQGKTLGTSQLRLRRKAGSCATRASVKAEEGLTAVGRWEANS